MKKNSKWIAVRKLQLLNEIIEIIHNSEDDTAFNSTLMRLVERYYMNQLDLTIKQLAFIKYNLVVK